MPGNLIITILCGVWVQFNQAWTTHSPDAHSWFPQLLYHPLHSPPKALKNRMGFSNLSICMHTYTHTLSHAHIYANRDIWYTWQHRSNYSYTPTPLPLATIIFFSVTMCPFLSFLSFLYSTYKWGHTVFVFLCPISLSIIPSKSTHVVANGKTDLFFFTTE